MYRVVHGTIYFYPRSPCGERQRADSFPHAPPKISIHALLAESDIDKRCKLNWHNGFLSTLSLRRATIVFPKKDRQIIFLSTLSLRRATARRASRQQPAGISIHALLAESDSMRTSLFCGCSDFYPRSPCGERLHYDNYNLHCVEISIHALLAESDQQPRQTRHCKKLRFLSTLSLRRATLSLILMTM